MTRLSERKTTARAETNAVYRGRPLIITLEPHEVLIRPKGKRTAYAVPWLAVFEVGQKLAAKEAIRLKKEAKHARRSMV